MKVVIPEEIRKFINSLYKTNKSFVAKARCLIVADMCREYGIDALPILTQMDQMGFLGNLDWEAVLDEVGCK